MDKDFYSSIDKPFDQMDTDDKKFLVWRTSNSLIDRIKDTGDQSIIKTMQNISGDPVEMVEGFLNYWNGPLFDLMSRFNYLLTTAQFDNCIAHIEKESKKLVDLGINYIDANIVAASYILSVAGERFCDDSTDLLDKDDEYYQNKILTLQVIGVKFTEYKENALKILNADKDDAMVQEVNNEGNRANMMGYRSEDSDSKNTTGKSDLPDIFKQALDDMI